MTEKEWNTRCRIMGFLDTSLIGRRTIVQDAEHPALGYTSKDGIIHVARDHDFFNRVTESEVRIMQMGINIHEAMHQILRTLMKRSASCGKSRITSKRTSL